MQVRDQTIAYVCTFPIPTLSGICEIEDSRTPGSFIIVEYMIAGHDEMAKLASEDSRTAF